MKESRLGPNDGLGLETGHILRTELSVFLRRLNEPHLYINSKRIVVPPPGGRMENDMKLIKKTILWLMFLMALIVIGCERKGSIYKFKINDTLESVLLMETDVTKENLCIVTDWENQGNASAIIPKRYIALIEAEGQEKNIIVGSNLIEKYSYKKFFINVYSLETQKLVKSYSLKDLKKNMPSDYHIKPSLSNCFRNNGQDYIKVFTSYVGQDSELMHKLFWLIINVDTDEMRFVDTGAYFDGLLESSEKMSRYNDQLRIFFDWTQEPDRYRFLSVNGFKLFDWEDYKSPTQSFSCTGRYSDTIGFPNEGIAEVRIATYALPKENKELYSKFPGLKQYQEQEGLVARIFLGNYPSAEEVMKLFLEEGQEISFEGCVMDGKYSINGLPHKINSFEEFDQWFKPKE